MNKILRCFVCFVGSIVFLSCRIESCGNSDKELKAGICIACWNVQTFFDANTSGCEYQEFKNSENWTEEKYKTRLTRLCDFITTIKADVFIFEELENSGILNDIYNCLAGNSWEKGYLWNYGTFAKDEGSAIGIGIISRLPLEDVKLHAMDVRIHTETQPSCRPMVEVTVVNGAKKIRLFVNHWKSKTSGVGEGEIWRQWQESILVHKLSENASGSAENQHSQNFVVCGDFNKDIQDFVYSMDSKQCRVCLRGINTPAGVSSASVKVKSPWLNDNGILNTKNGSYFFRDKWERIDHFFVSEEVEFSGFRVLDVSPWATEEGLPNNYKIYSGEGYSDHLPLICNVFF